MLKSRLAIFGALFAGVFGAQACGPDFQISLASCGTRCLAQIHGNPFEVEVRGILGSSQNPGVIGSPLPPPRDPAPSLWVSTIRPRQN